MERTHQILKFVTLTELALLQTHVNVTKVTQETNVNLMFALENHQMMQQSAQEKELVPHQILVNVILDIQEVNVN